MTITEIEAQRNRAATMGALMSEQAEIDAERTLAGAFDGNGDFIEVDEISTNYPEHRRLWLDEIKAYLESVSVREDEVYIGLPTPQHVFRYRDGLLFGHRVEGVVLVGTASSLTFRIHTKHPNGKKMLEHLDTHIRLHVHTRDIARIPGIVRLRSAVRKVYELQALSETKYSFPFDNCAAKWE